MQATEHYEDAKGDTIFLEIVNKNGIFIFIGIELQLKHRQTFINFQFEMSYEKSFKSLFHMLKLTNVPIKWYKNHLRFELMQIQIAALTKQSSIFDLIEM